MKPLVRMITTAEGKYLSLDDLKKLMADDNFIAECGSMIVIGKEHKASECECLRRAIAYAIVVAAGDTERVKGPTWKG